MKNSNEWIEDINVKVANKIEKRRKKQAVLVRLTTLTLSIMLIISAVIVYPKLTQRNPVNKDQLLNSQGNQEKSADNAIDDKEIRGLIVKNFNLSDIKTNAVTDRMCVTKFINFFQYNSADSFVLVRVTDTKSAREDEPFPEKHICTIDVLENVWGDSISGSIELTQSLYGGCVGDEDTNLLRKGGVYLLPLTIYNGTYYIDGDLDVLFEIDDKGLIWSHSNATDFNRFDGTDYKTVINEINRLTQDKTIMLAASPFGMLVQGQDWKFAEISVTAEPEMGKNPFGEKVEIYNSHLENLIKGDGLPSEMLIYSNDSNEKLPLTKGGYYLVFIDNYYGSQFVNKQRIARITEDGTIKNLGDKEGPFAPYNGYTIDQIMDLVDQITEYIKNNPK